MTDDFCDNCDVTTIARTVFQRTQAPAAVARVHGPADRVKKRERELSHTGLLLNHLSAGRRAQSYFYQEPFPEQQLGQPTLFCLFPPRDERPNGLPAEAVEAVAS